MPGNFGDAFLWMAVAGGTIFMAVLLYATARESFGSRR